MKFSANFPAAAKPRIGTGDLTGDIFIYCICNFIKLYFFQWLTRIAWLAGLQIFRRAPLAFNTILKQILFCDINRGPGPLKSSFNIDTTIHRLKMKTSNLFSLFQCKLLIALSRDLQNLTFYQTGFLSFDKTT